MSKKLEFKDLGFKLVVVNELEPIPKGIYSTLLNHMQNGASHHSFRLSFPI